MEEGKEKLVIFRPLRDLMHTEIEKYVEEAKVELPSLQQQVQESLPSGVPSSIHALSEGMIMTENDDLISSY
jgi:hypothetical protein